MNNLWRVLLALALLELELLAGAAAAQTVRADRVTLNVGPCTIFSGSAPPTGTVVGNICDTYIQTTTGALWTKASGTGTSSGWLAALAGAGTPGTIPQWTGTGASLGDSIVSQAAGVVTIAGAGTITGALSASSASITGAATIGGLATMNAANVTTTANVGGLATLGAASITGNATIGGTAAVTGASTLSGAVTLGSYIGTASYASQVAGWRITAGGAADVRYLYTDELRAKLFTADAESVLAGSMRVTKSYSTVAQPFTCPAASSTSPLWVYDASTYGDAPVFVANDWIVIHVLTRAAFGPFTITDCVGTVSSYVDGTGANAGSQTWTFTRGAGSNGGAMTASTVVAVNQLVQDLGVSGNGYVEMSAVDGPNSSNAPYIQTNTWTTAPVAANTSTQCRLGNLAGITGLGAEYGLLCGSPSTPPYSYVRLSNQVGLISNLPIRLYDVAGAAEVFRVDPTTLSLAMGNPLPASYGGSNTGVWMGKDTDNVYKLRIGNPAGNRLTWNGTVLSIAGEGSGITNINGGNIIAGTISASALTINGHPGGAALNPDPNVSDATFWPPEPARTSGVITTITDGMVGTTSLRSIAGNGTTGNVQSMYPIDRTKTYRAHLWARSGGGANGLFYFRLYTYSRANDTSSSTGSGTLNFEGISVPTTWTDYTAVLTPAYIPAGTTVASLGVYLNWTGTAGYMEVQDVRLEEVIPSTLIKDGTITTTKIASKTITADNIAANSITVGEINASGFGDNLIKNSTFEGSNAAALAGWSVDIAYSNGNVLPSCCGTRGPTTMSITPAAGNILGAQYLAVPVTAGQAYRVALDVYTAGVSGGFFLRMLESNSTGAVRYVRSLGTPPAGDVIADTNTTICNSCALPQGWSHLEYGYTPPVPANWVSLVIYNGTCFNGTYGSPCSVMHFDNVEMQPQIGSGHIRANSITAVNIAAGTITGDRIAARTIISGNIAAGTISATEIGAGTITGGNIAGGTITGSNIAGRTITAGALVANTITSNEIGVRAIVAGNIATGTLTANEIAAGTITGDRIAANTINSNNIQAGSITADRLAVTSLSAISANLGTITAGTINSITISSSTINSPTINAACTTINSNGLTLTPGQSSNCNWYKWNNGAGLYHDGGAWMGVSGASFRVDTPGGAGFLIDSNFNLNANSTINLNGYVTIAAGRNLTVSNLSGSGNRLVCTNNNGTLYVSAANGSC